MSAAGIPVYLRSGDQLEGRLIAEADVAGLDEIVEAVKEWGFLGEANIIVGQFFEKGFEVVVVDE